MAVQLTFFNAIILFFVAILAGALNSVAGGGSFFSFPALLFTGVPAINANATNTIALWPGAVASVGAYRRDVGGQPVLLITLCVASLIGGLLGAVLLLRTPEPVFVELIPFLLLAATLLFTFSGQITRYLRTRFHHPARAQWVSLLGVGLLQLAIAVYGGFFGGGIGILMLASLALIGMENIHRMNALKTLLSSLINGIAVVTFVLAGVVFWPQAVLMIVGAVIGGYGGASIARRLDPLLVRRFVITVAFGMTIYFFIR